MAVLGVHEMEPSHEVTPRLALRIVGVMRPYRGMLLVFLGLTATMAAMGAVEPLIYRAIVDDGIQRHDAGVVVVLAGVLAGLGVVAALVGVLQASISTRIGEGLLCAMRVQLFEHVMEMPIAFFTRSRTGAVTARVHNDVLSAPGAFTQLLASTVETVLTVAFAITAMLALSWRLSLLALAVLPVCLVAAQFSRDRMARVGRATYKVTGEMTTMLVEFFSVSGALLVKLYGRPDSERSLFAAKAHQLRELSMSSATYGAIIGAGFALTGALITALVYGVGGALAAERAVTVGTIVALAAYLGQLYGPLTGISSIARTMVALIVSFDRIFEVLDLDVAIRESEGSVALSSAPLNVELVAVDFAYPNSVGVPIGLVGGGAETDALSTPQILFDVTFRAQPGQVVALVGPSGSGKTTIGYLIARLYDVHSGCVRIGGVDVRAATTESLRETVGLVTQDAHLFHDTLRANLEYARPGAADDEVIEALRGAQAVSLLDGLPEGLDTVVGERGFRLSGGQRQRIAIARLLLKRPRIVILDEATAHLDSESEAAVYASLRVALRGCTIIVIADRLSTIQTADQILVLVRGRIVERGTHDELYKGGSVYTRLCQAQNRAAKWWYSE